MAELATETRHMALKMLGDLRADRYVARAFGHQLASIERAVRIGGPDDRCPSYNGLLIIAQSVCGALARAGLTDCDDPGEAIDVMRVGYERRIAELSAMTGGDHIADASKMVDSDHLVDANKVIESAMAWPNAREVGRIGDMHQNAALRVGFDADNDVYISHTSNEPMGSVEFCNGMNGGGKSPRTREALIALMVAMEQDNAADPSRDWWARRNGVIAAAGGEVPHA